MTMQLRIKVLANGERQLQQLVAKNDDKEAWKPVPVVFEDNLSEAALYEKLERETQKNKRLQDALKGALVFVEGWEKSYNKGEQSFTGKVVRSALED